MEVSFPPLIPAPPDRETFIRDSHFQLAYDHRPEGSTVVSPYRIDYPPRWGSYQRKPILPPKCAGVLNQDMDNSWDTRSETYIAYPAWPLGPRPEICLPTSHLQPHADSRQHISTSITHESYPCPSSIPRFQPNRVDKWDDSFPSGDKEKMPLPESLYQQSYQAHKDVPLAIKAPSQHLGGDSVLKGDGCTRHNTLYQSQYTAERGPPAQRCPKDVVSLVFGDPRYHQTVSEQKRAYTVQQSEGCHYDPQLASAKVHQTNIQPGDGCHRFSTIMSESFPWRDPGPAVVSSCRKNVSSVLQGDLKDDISITNHRFYYREPNVKNLVPQPLGRPAKICLGDKHWSSFSTTQQSDYQPPPEMQKVKIKDNNLLKTNIAFNYPVSGALTTSTQDMLIPHQQPKHQLTEEDKQKIKYSHLVLPWKELCWFSTEQKDKYTNKYCGPITLATGDFQCSSVPLGTMRKYKPRQKMAP
ncbi:stabilizer of axonemal microtubules 5 [Tiliqua scincoides]|uniref:stabilizer of axonemal microtubules 5 n=1 Tax=Tiliqua scincoides TaxID=71010 RepID=UPI003462EF25